MAALLVAVQVVHGVNVYSARLEKVSTLAAFAHDFGRRVMEMETPLPVAMFTGSKLVDQQELAQLVLLDGGVQVRQQAQVQRPRGLGAGVVDGHRLAQPLGLEHRLLGAAQQRLGGVGMFGPVRHAQRHRQVQRLPLPRQLVLHLLAQLRDALIERSRRRT